MPPCAQWRIAPTFAAKFIVMKKTILPFLALALLSFAACKEDPYPLDLHTFGVDWIDYDLSHTQTVADELFFTVQINSTDPDSDSQYITEWEFTYYVNDHFGGVLQGDDHIQTNSLFFEANIIIENLTLPGPGALVPGDVIEFRLWARDNHGTELEHVHRYVIEN